jgi:hypothetical protein
MLQPNKGSAAIFLWDCFVSLLLAMAKVIEIMFLPII